MTKLNIIRFLQNLPPHSIKCLDIVYHKITFDSSVSYYYNYSTDIHFSEPPLCNTPLIEVLLSLYKLRGNIRAIHLVFFDSRGQLDSINYVAKKCNYSKSLSDFINFKK